MDLAGGGVVGGVNRLGCDLFRDEVRRVGPAVGGPEGIFLGGCGAWGVVWGRRVGDSGFGWVVGGRWCWGDAM